MRAAAVRRAGLAVLAGLLLYAGHPPLDQAWAGLVAVVPLLWLAWEVAEGTAAGRRGFLYGLLAGVVFFGPLLEWIARFGVIAWVLLVLLQAIFVGLFVAGLARFGARRGFGLAAVGLWAGVEALRTWVPLGGFPWGVLGNTQAGGPLLPAARSVGVLGVGALCVVVSGVLFVLARALVARSAPPIGAFVTLLGVAAATAVLGLPSATASGERLDIAAIQGNDMVETASIEDRRVRQVAARMAQTTMAFAREAPSLPDVVVWPENALDRDVTADESLGAIVQPALVALRGTPVLAGMLTDGPREGTFRNTVTELRAGPVAGERYVKRKIVPFGEYVPGRRWLDWVAALDQIPEDAAPGEQATLFEVGAANVGVPICFENIFPSVTHDLVRAGADVLVVSTNNASYGFSAASRQHLAFSRLRAVEADRWVLHAGISGVSAVVDHAGRVSQVTEPFELAVVRADLPLRTGLTPAVRFGGWIEWAAVLAAAIVWLLPLLQRRRGVVGEEAAV